MERFLKFFAVTIILVAPVVCCALLILMLFPLIGMIFIVPAVFNLYYSLGMIEPDECIYREILS